MTDPSRVCCHYGEWVQGRLGAEGPVVLITLACGAIGVTAQVEASEVFGVTGNAKLSDQTANKFLSALNVPLPKLRITLSSDVTPGVGAGVSTASLLALARVLGIDATPQGLAQAALSVEGAVDPLMFDAPDCLLWASRRAQVVKPVEAPPAFEVVGGLFGPPIRTEPGDGSFPDVSDLVGAWDASTGSREDLGRLASEAARRTTAMRGPSDDPTEAIADELGAIGHVRAHTGSARGVLFRPGTVPERAKTVCRAAGLKDVFTFTTGGAS